MLYHPGRLLLGAYVYFINLIQKVSYKRLLLSKYAVLHAIATGRNLYETLTFSSNIQDAFCLQGSPSEIKETQMEEDSLSGYASFPLPILRGKHYNLYILNLPPVLWSRTLVRIRIKAWTHKNSQNSKGTMTLFHWTWIALHSARLGCIYVKPKILNGK